MKNEQDWDNDDLNSDPLPSPEVDRQLRLALRQVIVPGDLKSALRSIPNSSIATPREERATSVKPLANTIENTMENAATLKPSISSIRFWRWAVGAGAAATAACLLWAWNFGDRSGLDQINRSADLVVALPTTEPEVHTGTELPSIEELELQLLVLQTRHLERKLKRMAFQPQGLARLPADEELALTLVAAAETSLLVGYKTPSTKANLDYVIAHFSHTTSAEGAHRLLEQF